MLGTEVLVFEVLGSESVKHYRRSVGTVPKPWVRISSSAGCFLE